MLRGDTDPLQRLAAASAVLSQFPRFSQVAPGQARPRQSQGSSPCSTNSGHAEWRSPACCSRCTDRKGGRSPRAVGSRGDRGARHRRGHEGAFDRARRHDAAPTSRIRSGQQDAIQAQSSESLATRHRRHRRDVDGPSVNDGPPRRSGSPQARLILVGDPEQLASVEAGTVLGDVVGPVANGLHIESQHQVAVRSTGDDIPAVETP